MGQTASCQCEDEVGSIQLFHANELERRLAFKNLQNERSRALELVVRRERFGWEVIGALTLTCVLFGAGIHYRRPDMVIPMVPLVMGAGCSFNAAYGLDQQQVKEKAEQLLKQHPTWFGTIGGPVTLREIDECRRLTMR